MTDPFIGHTIVALRPMTAAEMHREYWQGEAAPIVIELDNGNVIYPSRDEEGNGPGILFGCAKQHGDQRNVSFAFYPPR